MGQMGQMGQRGQRRQRELNKITLAKHHSFPRAAKCKISFFLIFGGSGE